ncbi:uncharacterized protein ACIBXB_002343 [Morphnus guianensis]
MSPHAELVSRLRAGWLLGKTRPMEYRLAQLEALGCFLDEKKQDILEATAADMHKPPFEVEVSELSICRSELNHTLNKLGTWMKDKHVEKNWAMQLDSAFIRKDPYGVVLIIGPWNYPINLLLVPLIGAIAAGNCVVMKPSEITRNVERLVAEMLPRHLDEDCFAVVTAGMEETTRLLENKFNYIFFTGSPSVGRIVMTAAAKHLTPVTLELGGKNQSGQLLWPRPCSREEGAPTSPAVHVLVYPRQQGGGSQGVPVGCSAPLCPHPPGGEPGAGADEQRSFLRQRHHHAHDDPLTALWWHRAERPRPLPRPFQLRNLLAPAVRAASRGRPGDPQHPALPALRPAPPPAAPRRHRDQAPSRLPPPPSPAAAIINTPFRFRFRLRFGPAPPPHAGPITGAAQSTELPLPQLLPAPAPFPSGLRPMRNESGAPPPTPSSPRLPISRPRPPPLPGPALSSAARPVTPGAALRLRFSPSRMRTELWRGGGRGVRTPGSLGEVSWDGGGGLGRGGLWWPVVACRGPRILLGGEGAARMLVTPPYPRGHTY